MTNEEKYFIQAEYGGYSTIHADDRNGYTLPNCKAYAFGMLHKEKGKKDMTKLPKGNANTMYTKCKKDGSGYTVGKNVREQSVLCYDIGANGHVVYCHYKIDYGDYRGYWVCSESNYSGTVKNGKFIRYFVTKSPETYYSGYQGCVYKINY